MRHENAPMSDVESWLADVSKGDRRRRAIDDPYLHKFQRRHFLLYNVTPGALSLVACGLLFVRPVSAIDGALFGALWLMTGLGISAGYHRLFTHKSWDAPRLVRATLAVWGSMAGMGPVISWAAIHRRHHECADGEGDMHSPNLHGKGARGRIRGFIHAHFTWMARHPYANVAFYAPDLLRDRTLVWIGRRYHTWVAAGVLVPTLVGGLVSGSWWGALTGFLWGGAVRMWVVGNSIWALNSVLHTMGSRRFQEHPTDESRNSWLLALFAWGEGWHNNHHSFPASASFGLDWYRADLSYWFIRSLALVGLASDVRVPSRKKIIDYENEARRNAADGAL